MERERDGKSKLYLGSELYKCVISGRTARAPSPALPAALAVMSGGTPVILDETPAFFIKL